MSFEQFSFIIFYMLALSFHIPQFHIINGFACMFKCMPFFWLWNYHIFFQQLLGNLDRDLQYAIRVEGKMDVDSITNYEDVKKVIAEKVNLTCKTVVSSLSTPKPEFIFLKCHWWDQFIFLKCHHNLITLFLTLCQIQLVPLLFLIFISFLLWHIYY